MDQPVTVNFVPEQVLTWVIVGLLAGLTASMLVRGRGLSFVGSVAVGLLGALIGGFLFTILNIQQVPTFFGGGLTVAWADILVAVIGAALIVLLYGGFYRRRYYNRG
jgi:uncharacterized membrane protein YeaQ/YmgE (transglycosylase-associated protein family)